MKARLPIFYSSLITVLGILAYPLLSHGSDSPVARIGKEVITLSDIDREGEDEIWDARVALYALRKEVLTDMVDGKLLEWEARNRGIGVHALELQEIQGKVEQANDHIVSIILLSFAETGLVDEDIVNDADFREDIRKELLPDILLELRRRDFINQLREKYRVEYLLEEPILEYKRYPLEDIGGYLIGNENAPVTMAYLYSIDCTICKQVEEELRSVLNQYPNQIRLFVINPFLSFDEREVRADRASRCANEQGNFWDYHQALFGLSDYSDPALVNIAAETSLDIPDFTDCLLREASRIEPGLSYETLDARFHLEGTPTFFVNGIKSVGLPAVYELGKLVEAELHEGSDEQE